MATRRESPPSTQPCRSVGWPSRPTSPTCASFSRRRWRATSAARASLCTAVANGLPTSTRRRTPARPPSARSGVLAADGDDLAGHVGGVVAGEEHDHVRDLPWLGRAAERLAGHELVDRLLRHDLGKVLVHGQAW